MFYWNFIHHVSFNIHRRLNTNEDEAIAFLDNYNTEYCQVKNQHELANWSYETNLTDENAMAVVSIWFPFNENSFFIFLFLNLDIIKGWS
jgi:hypothetical protein